MAWEEMAKVLATMLPLLVAVVGWRTHRLSVIRAKHERMQRLNELAKDPAWDKGPGLVLQIAVQDAFHRGLDERWIRLVIAMPNALPLLKDAAFSAPFLALGRDRRRLVDPRPSGWFFQLSGLELAGDVRRAVATRVREHRRQGH